MEVAKAIRTALMAGTLLTQREPLNGFGGDRQANAAAWLGHPTAGDAPRWVGVIAEKSDSREPQGVQNVLKRSSAENLRHPAPHGEFSRNRMRADENGQKRIRDSGALLSIRSFSSGR